MGRATVRAALAAAMVLGAQPAAAMAQEPVAPASPEALHGQIVAALKAQPMVGVTMTAGDDDVPEMTTVTGVYDVKGQRFSGHGGKLWGKGQGLRHPQSHLGSRRWTPMLGGREGR